MSAYALVNTALNNKIIRWKKRLWIDSFDHNHLEQRVDDTPTGAKDQQVRKTGSCTKLGWVTRVTHCYPLTWQPETLHNKTIKLNPLECRCNYSSTSNDIKLVHWPLMGGLLHLVQQGGDWGAHLAHALLAVPNVTAHPSTASAPITVLLYDGPLLCSFNVPIKS